MIGSSFLSAGSWNPDDILIEEFAPLSMLDDSKSNNDLIDRLKQWDEQSGYSLSPVHSNTSEEYELLVNHLTTTEECNFNIPDDIASILPISDHLTSELLEQESKIDSLDSIDFDWFSIPLAFNEASSSTESTGDVSSTQRPTPKKRKRRTKSPVHISISKSWSKMSQTKRYEIAQALFSVISGLRRDDQCQIIKFIDPSTVLSESTTEFSIGLSYLNDAKLQTVCEYLTKHANCSIDFLKSSVSSKGKPNRTKRKSKKSDVSSEDLKQWRWREKKVIKQDKKEKQSGLFVKEIKINKLSDPQDENEDVNILE